MAAREEWRSHSGFVLATIGAAVGLGNIWRFAYIVGENGGGAFLLLYFGCVLLIGLPLVIAELTLGRRAQGDAVAAFSGVGIAPGWRLVGWWCGVGAVLILSYYSVISGWALRYFAGAASGGLWESAADGYGAFFARFIGDGMAPAGWQAAMLALAMFVVAGGVRRGIELVSRWLMPVLAAIVVVLAGFALTLEGGGAGVEFLFAPDWSVLARPSAYGAALGQAFFSVGVGMAVYVTYGSYVPRSFALPASAGVVVFGDTLFAMVAGLAIFPAVFALGGDPAAGPELAFITLPQILLQMPAGRVVGVVFFFLLTAAALTSMIALLEVVVAMLVHRWNWRRWSATAAAGMAIFVVGLPSALSYGLLREVQLGGKAILDAIDAAVSSILLPMGGLLVAAFVGWALRRGDALRDAGIDDGAVGSIWLWLLRIGAPAAIAVILARTIFSF
ncbi:MAG: sodium-dependent transporter [Alphaproteobacteria bacterium]